jgi:hypothetical protein
MRREAISSPSDARIIGFKLRRGAVMCVTTRDGSGGKSCRVFARDPMGGDEKQDDESGLCFHENSHD